MAGFGKALLFINFMLLTVLLTAATLALAARFYMTTVIDTAAGNDRVSWASEAVVDWIGRAVHLGWLLALWLVPAGFAARGLGEVLFPGDPALRTIVLAGPLLVFGFPLGVLSSLGAPSPWIPVYPPVLLRLPRVAGPLAWFYLVALGLGVPCAALWYGALFSAEFWLLPAAAAFGAAYVLIHARLLGRVGWLLQGHLAPSPTDPGGGRSRGGGGGSLARVRRRPKKPVKRPKVAGRPAYRDPWNRPKPDPEGPPPATPEAGYGVVTEAANVPDFYSRDLAGTQLAGPADPLPAPAEEPAPEVPEETYGLGRGDRHPGESGRAIRSGNPAGRAARAPAEPGKEAEEDPDVGRANRVMERELALRGEGGEPPPEWPLVQGVFTFPWYDTSLKAWVGLAIAGTAAGLAFRAMLAYLPS